MKLTNNILALIAAVASTVSTVSADTGESTGRTASNLHSRMVMEGFTVRDRYQFGTLNEGYSSIYWTTLQAGNEYAIAVEGAGGALDVDIRVYDENNNLVGADIDGTNVGVAIVTPRWTGRFRIEVTMADTVRGSGAFVIQFGFK